ncbi:hypothetical protein PQI66_05365 [Corynebacterium sp. USCH3]|uniref:hypothetical protein n=1 Tax=Corynebacterium sp. USCH3 TaxID=3024840 RepID=UPI00309F64B1
MEETTTMYTATALTQMPHSDLLSMFSTLQAPTLSEMTGEFNGTPLKQPTIFRAVVAAVKVRNPLYLWTAKGFRPVDETTGRGYNVHLRAPGGRRVLRDPMTTSVGLSDFDGLPAFRLDYRTFDTLNGTMNLLDDVRRVTGDLYLGFGMLGFTDRQRSVPQPFMFERTSRPYSSDVGVRRSEQRHGAPIA